MAPRGRGTTVMMVLVVGLGACGSSAKPHPTTSIAPASTVPATSSTARAATPSTTLAATSGTGTSQVRVYFLRDAKVAATHRQVMTTPATATASLVELLAGTNDRDRAGGMSSAIPTGTRLLGLTIDAGTATVDFSGPFASGGESRSTMGPLAQVTYTLTQFPGVSGVKFRLDGTPVTVFSSAGLVVDHPTTRADFESLTPAILVEDPAPNDTIAPGWHVTGTANTFEAAFRVQLLDPAGRVLDDQGAVATSGTGTRGTFDVVLRPISASPGPARLVVFDLSAKDGSRQDIVEIPVVLGTA